MITKLKWIKISNSLPMAKCWYCRSPTNHALYELDGSEIWCCADCYKIHGTIRRHKSPSKSKSLKIFANNKEENDSNSILKDITEVQINGNTITR